MKPGIKIKTIERALGLTRDEISNLGDITPTQIVDIKNQLGPFSDWFLGSRDEVKEMHTVLHLYSLGGFSEVWYQSSSEYVGTPTLIEAIDFLTGNNYQSSKGLALNIRAIRAFTSITNYNLRDIGPAGGYIFWKSGNNYLESAPEDITAAVFSNITTALGTTLTAIGTGQANTTAIIGQSSHTSSAAKLCNDLIVGAAEVSLTTEQIEAIAALIPAVDISGKVDKITGKGLSTEDYTTTEKNKLALLGGPVIIPTAWGKYY